MRATVGAALQVLVYQSASLRTAVPACVCVLVVLEPLKSTQDVCTGRIVARSADLYLILLDPAPILLALAQGRFETLVPARPHQASQSSRPHASEARRPVQNGWALGEEDRETLPLSSHVLRRPRPRCSMRVKPTRPSPSSKSEEGMPASNARSAGSRMMHRGLTLREYGATALRPPRSAAILAQNSAISIISPLHQRQQQQQPRDPHPHLFASASFSGAWTKRRAVPAGCAVPACFRHVWRLLSARGSGTWRRTLSSQPGPGHVHVPFVALLFLCLQRGGTGGLIIRLSERERMAASRGRVGRDEQPTPSRGRHEGATSRLSVGGVVCAVCVVPEHNRGRQALSRQ